MNGAGISLPSCNHVAYGILMIWMQLCIFEQQFMMLCLSPYIFYVAYLLFNS